MPTIARLSGTKFTAIIEGGPELARRLAALDLKIKKQASKEAVQAAGYEIATEWASRVPIGEPPEDEHPGAYQRAMLDDDAVRVRATANGASGVVSPALLYDLPVKQQPWIYAAVLEFGDAEREPRPSARAAFEAALNPALQVLGDVLRRFI
jgi:hypothetical protein